MFFIDDDQTQIAEGQEQGRARADDQSRATFAHHLPRAAAFGHGHAGVPFGGPRAEARLDPVQEFGGERDLGQKDKRLPTRLQTRGDRFEIDLGLARACDALEERGAVGLGLDSGPEIVCRLCLLVGQVAPRRAGVEAGIGEVAGAGLFVDDALFDEALHHRGRDTGHLGQFAQREGQTAIGLERLDDAAAGVGPAVGHALAPAIDTPHTRRVAEARRAGGEPQHGGHGRQGVIPCPDKKFPHIIPHRNRIQNADHRPHLGEVVAALALAPDDADDLARAKRHLDESTCQAAAFGRLVVEKPVDRLGRQDRDQIAFVEVVQHRDPVSSSSDGRARLLQRSARRVAENPRRSPPKSSAKSNKTRAFSPWNDRGFRLPAVRAISATKFNPVTRGRPP